MIQKITLLLINLIFGSMVLFSYYSGLNREPELSLKLWGGVPLVLQPIIVAFMFISAIGYFFFTYNFLVNADANKILFFNKFNYWSLHLIYSLILIPSMLWINRTFIYMNSGNLMDWIFVVLILSCVAFFSIILLLFTIDMHLSSGLFIYLSSVIGASIFAFHTVFLDGLIWVFFFHRTR